MFLAGLSVYLRLLLRGEALLYAGIVYPQELPGSSRHVDVVVLNFSALLIHEGVHGVPLILALQYNGAYSEHSST